MGKNWQNLLSIIIYLYQSEETAGIVSGFDI